MPALKGVRFGSYEGPTGRKRNLYNVEAFRRGTFEKRENAYAYGGEGVRKAKKSITVSQKKVGYKALKFRTYNQTRGRFLKS